MSEAKDKYIAPIAILILIVGASICTPLACWAMRGDNPVTTSVSRGDWVSAGRRCVDVLNSNHRDIEQAKASVGTRSVSPEGLDKHESLYNDTGHRVEAQLLGVLSGMDPIPVQVKDYPVRVLASKAVCSVDVNLFGAPLRVGVPVAVEITGDLPTKSF